MRIQRQFYGWYDPSRGNWQNPEAGRYLVSREPPDSPVRPAVAFDSAEEAIEAIKKRRRAEIVWFPPLTKAKVRRAG